MNDEKDMTEDLRVEFTDEQTRRTRELALEILRTCQDDTFLETLGALYTCIERVQAEAGVESAQVQYWQKR